MQGKPLEWFETLAKTRNSLHLGLMEAVSVAVKKPELCCRKEFVDLSHYFVCKFRNLVLGVSFFFAFLKCLCNLVAVRYGHLKPPFFLSPVRFR